MAQIEELKIGTAVLYRDILGEVTAGKIVGRRFNGGVEGDVDPDGYPYSPGEEPDRVKVAFLTKGVPPEDISVSCSPDQIEVNLNPTFR
ncbi:hypothetical protein [Acidisoma cladoniae]|uniref:hypothetical protein n=1 Tax=Acidisoma cladoniae TaxID=3040935 RepID=UPI00254E7704|nr:hypothetical protein [Acidisoma sp. PAMC 29798]